MTDARPLVWVEPCAGMLACGLWLRAGCEPPIAYLGGKRWARAAILDGLGLRRARGSDELWIADSGPAGKFWRELDRDGASVVRRLRSLPVPGSVDAARDLYARLDREDPAEWLLAAGWSFRAGQATTGFKACPQGGPAQVSVRLESLVARVERAAIAIRGARIYSDAREIPVHVTGRTIVLIDPPYLGTTGYGAQLSRSDVQALASRWSEAGAEVLVTELEAVMPHWVSEPLSGTSTGSARGKWEVLTLSPSVAWRDEQPALFGGSAMASRAPGGSAMTGGVGRTA